MEPSEQLRALVPMKGPRAKCSHMQRAYFSLQKADYLPFPGNKEKLLAIILD